MPNYEVGQSFQWFEMDAFVRPDNRLSGWGGIVDDRHDRGDLLRPRFDAVQASTALPTTFCDASGASRASLAWARVCRIFSDNERTVAVICSSAAEACSRTAACCSVRCCGSIVIYGEKFWAPKPNQSC
ncbi:hypothetical protein EJC49_04235 [Aquibium carbonis]|uniref:Uncharacterized protein n=1 Tax=Aquibium carbonis TaxID=2495581 RepID=A0A3R9ZU06_9HYPH|nr:hypothetical protein [Aquibium carbonis]RST87721.1 hypothetical protein EJC49_04235 [Aquibium carbonis]